MAEWKEWNEKGMQDCLNSEGFILRFEDGTESNIMSAYPQITSKKITHYWIIPWTKCSERMPPDDDSEIFIRKLDDWIEYTGSDEQIAEMKNAKHGYIIKYVDTSGFDVGMGESDIIFDEPQDKEVILSYWIIPADPLREMKIRQSMTGQPVWVRDCMGTYCTTKPDWKIPNAEYSFAPFED